jgi:uncharacterized protein YjbI with pentapeptide repeats
MPPGRVALLALALSGAAIPRSGAADLTVRQVTEALVAARPDRPAALAHHDLSRLDLSSLDFRGADLEGSDLTAADLTDADLSGARLAHARLDLAIVIRAKFVGADLSEASLVRLATSSGLEPDPGEAPSFVGANLSQAHVFARLSRADMHGARLAGAQLGVEPRTPRTMNLIRTELSGCNLAGAILAGADLTGALLSFVDLAGADLSQADLRRADLSHADLTGADLTGAQFSGADLEGAVLLGATGLERSIGLEDARNAGKIVH